jgi:hypothetical protein
MNMDEALQAAGAPEGPGPRTRPVTFLTEHRRSDFDVTNTVQVSSAESVRRAVRELFTEMWPGTHLDALDQAFADFERLYHGRFPGYHGCDTIYHDLQHSLDGTLAAARLVVAHDRVQPVEQHLGAERATVAVIVALFHDSGYIRRVDEHMHSNGAEFTQSHVSRSAEFLRLYLPTLGFATWAEVSAQMVHFTGYEKKFDQIDLPDPLDRTAGHLIGTGDLIAQMSDRCYLEKCRDHLYPEFVLGGLATPAGNAASSTVPIGCCPSCSTGAIHTWRPSIAISITWRKYCEPATGPCFGASRPASPGNRIRCRKSAS